MLIAPPFGLLAHGRAVSKDCPHSQTSLFYSIHAQKSRSFFAKINVFSTSHLKIGRPGWSALCIHLAAAAARVAAAVVPAVIAAAAAIAEDQQQDDDPPPVVPAEAAAHIVVTTHNDYLRNFEVEHHCSHSIVFHRPKKVRRWVVHRRRFFTEFSVRPPARSCPRSSHPSS